MNIEEAMLKVAEGIYNRLVELGADQRTIQCKACHWQRRISDTFGMAARVQLAAWVEYCLDQLPEQPWSAELVVRRETKNFPIEGHRHPNTKSSVFLKTWFGEPTILEDGPAKVGATLFLKDEWHAAPDTKEPRLVTLLYCKFEKDQF